MKKVIFLFLFVCIQAVKSQPVTIDEDKASVNFLFLDDDVDGTLSDLKFTGNIDLKQLELASIGGTVASETIDTDNWLRNRHLRNKYFKVKEYPVLSFKSSSIIASKDIFMVAGLLTIKGIEKPVTFTLSKKMNQLVMEASINASQFDIFIHDEPERNKVDIVIVLPY